MDDEKLTEEMKRVPTNAEERRAVRKILGLPPEERQAAWKEFTADLQRPANQRDVYDFVRRTTLGLE